MNPIVEILLILFSTAIVLPALGRVSKTLRNGVIFAGMTWASIVFLGLYGKTSSFSWSLMGFHLTWHTNMLSWFFGSIVMGLAFLIVPFTFTYLWNHERQDYFYFAFVMTVASMMGILFSADFLSLFFFWEIMTWSSFLNVIYYRYEAQKAGLKYFVMSVIGAYSMLLAIVFLYSKFGVLDFSTIAADLPALSTANLFMVFTLFSIGFGVKAAVIPLHTWAPDAYEASPAPFTALFSGALSKMGAYGFVILLFVLAGGKLMQGFGSVLGTPTFHYVIAWFGAVTAFVATIIAVVQEDGKKLLAYSSVGQVGYIILGLGVASTLGVAGAFFQALNHAIFKGMLFLVMGAVFYRTGTHRMDELGGLIKKMPYSFVIMLFGIITLAGIPPLSGFPAKWILYEALINNQMVFLLIVAMIASTGAFLYAYRLIASVFLGPLPEQFEDVKEVPWSMRIPMLILLSLTVLFGVRPSLALSVISKAMAFVPGVAPLNVGTYHLTAPTGHVNPFTVASTVGTVLLGVAVALTWFWSKSKKATQNDIHTSGEPIPEGASFKYATDFYKPFARAFWMILKNSADRFYTSLAANLENLFDYLRFVYTGNGQTYALYVILFLATLFIFARHIVF
ncbi:MAG: hypothetical protein GXO76_00125 [Calditrichaeota bacterium]|nr:hypothetical protein [Calditrichota bacterium]